MVERIKCCDECGGRGRVREDGEVLECEYCFGAGEYLPCGGCEEPMPSDSPEAFCALCVDAHDWERRHASEHAADRTVLR